MLFKKINYTKLFLLTLTGTLLGLSFPPFETGILSLFAFIPLFLVLSDVNGRNFLNTYYAFFVFNLISISWVGGFNHAKDIYLMIAGAALLIVHPFIQSLPFAVFNYIHKNLSFKAAIYSFPFLWVSFEYLHSITEFAFPWLTLGNTLTYDLSLIQIAEYVGAYGLSFWIAVFNVLVFILIVKYIFNELSLKDKKTVLLVTSIVVLYLIPKFYGNYTLSKQEEFRGEKKVKVGIIQANIDPWEKWDFKQVHDQVRKQLDLSVIIAEQCDLIIWSETGIPFLILQPYNKSYLDSLRAVVDSLNFSLLTGFPDIYYYKPGEDIPKSAKKMVLNDIVYYDTYNSSLLLIPNDTNIQKYSKIRLVPFSERVPYAEVLHFLNFLEWNVGISGWAIGKDTTVFYFPLKNSNVVKFSNLICYESIYPSFVREFVMKGAEFLTIITNDSWWGNSFGPYQHFRYAVLRAVENRRWIARCANGGISCFIDPYGNVYNTTNMFTTEVIQNNIYTNNKFTFYTIKGDVIPEFSLLLIIFVITAAISKKVYKKIREKNDELH